MSISYSMSSPKTSPIQYTPPAPQNLGQKAAGMCLADYRVISNDPLRCLKKKYHVLGSINSKAVDVVSLNKILDPGLISRNDIWQLGIDIRKRDLGVTKPAVLLAGDVTPVNRTVGMVMGLQDSK